MAKAGWCSQCGANVWLTPEGACAQGHGAGSISGTYEVPDPSVPSAEAKCPKCGSTQIHAAKRGYTLGTGFIGANEVLLTCMACGHGFEPGKESRTSLWNRKVF